MENIYKTIFEDTIAGFWDWDIAAETIYLSPGYKAMFGYAENELSNSIASWKSLIHQQDLHLIINSIADQIKSRGKVPHNVEARFIHKNRSVTWVMCIGSVTVWEGNVARRMAGCIIDIDRQKKIQQELQISEKQFKSAFEYSAIGMALVSPQGRYLRVNKKLCQITGYTADEMHGLSFQDITYPEDLEADLYLLDQLANKQIDNYQLEKRYLHKNGEIVWVLLSVSLVRNELDDPLHFVSQVQNITQSKKAEVKLKDSQDKYRKLFRSVQDIFFKVDAGGIIVDISPSIEKYEGYKQETFIGKPADTFYFNPSERQAVVDALTKHGKIDDFDIRLRTPGGRFVYTSINAYVIYDEKGNYAGSEGSIRDITTRVLAEDALKARDALLTKLSEQIPGVIYQFQVMPDGRSFFPFVSNGVTDLYGLTADDIRYDSSPVFNRVHPDDFEIFNSSITESYNTLNKWELEFRVNVPGKGTRWLKGISKPAKQDDGSVLWHGFVADVTEQKLKEQQVQATYDLVSDQNSRLVNFAYIISHNLRTHSGNFEMLVKLLDDAVNDYEREELMKHMRKVSLLLSETIMHLNEVVSIQTSVRKVSMTINLFEYIEKAIEVLTVKSSKDQVVITNDVPYNFEIEYNAAYLESIIFNFVSNGIKYGHPDRKTIIDISACHENGHPVLKIADNGIGIDLDRNGDKLFGMYKTFHNNADAKGIGLFITKNQVEAMGGKIEVESEVNMGTCFKIYLS